MSTHTKREPWLVEAGQRFITIRRAAGESQRSLAKKSGVARQTIQRLEDGLTFPGSSVRVKLAEALGCPNLGRLLMEER